MVSGITHTIRDILCLKFFSLFVVVVKLFPFVFLVLLSYVLFVVRYARGPIAVIIRQYWRRCSSHNSYHAHSRFTIFRFVVIEFSVRRHRTNFHVAKRSYTGKHKPNIPISKVETNKTGEHP
jgi:hypothetical protein